MGAARRRLLLETLPAEVEADDRLPVYFVGHGIAPIGEDGSVSPAGPPTGAGPPGGSTKNATTASCPPRPGGCRPRPVPPKRRPPYDRAGPARHRGRAVFALAASLDAALQGDVGRER